MHISPSSWGVSRMMQNVTKRTSHSLVQSASELLYIRCRKGSSNDERRGGGDEELMDGRGLYRYVRSQFLLCSEQIRRRYIAFRPSARRSPFPSRLYKYDTEYVLRYGIECSIYRIATRCVHGDLPTYTL